MMQKGFIYSYLRSLWISNENSRVFNFIAFLSKILCLNKYVIKGNNNSLKIKGVISLNSIIKIKGNSNSVIIDKGTILNHTKLIVQGNNIVVTIGKRNFLGRSEFYIEDDDSKLIIGEHNGFGGNNHVAVTEGSCITFGDNCLMAQNVMFRSGDSHGIYNLDSKHRINNAKDIIIGSHIWFCYNTTILKGVCIFDDTVVATGAVVTKSIEQTNCIIAGSPAKIVKQGIFWTHSRAHNL